MTGSLSWNIKKKILVIITFNMKKKIKNEDQKPRKVQIVFEVEENQTKCCECLFGHVCPYACAFGDKLDCAKYDLGTMVLKEIKTIE